MTVTVRTNGSAVAADLGKIGGLAFARVRVAVQSGGEIVKNRWKANAAASAGVHGKHYPKAITSRMTGGTEATVFPDPSMPQGGMSFEYGSRNQPPHLDGQRAIDASRELILARIATALDVG